MDKITETDKTTMICLPWINPFMPTGTKLYVATEEEKHCLILIGWVYMQNNKNH